MKRFYKRLSVIMTIILVITTLPPMPVSAEDDDLWTDYGTDMSWYYDSPAYINAGDNWMDSGNYNDQKYDKDYPTFYITNAAELASVAKLVNEGTDDFKNKMIFLKNDIDLSSHNWVPIGTASKPFRGTISYQGKGNCKITGLNIKELSGVKYYGFVGYAETMSGYSGCTISRLEISGNINIGSGSESEIFVGSAAGYIENGEISDFNANVNISVDRSGAVVHAGGIVGESSGSVLNGCINGNEQSAEPLSIKGNTVNAGGLAGKTTGNTRITGNYANKESANYAEITVNADNADVGCLVGNVGGRLLIKEKDDDGADLSAKYVWNFGNLNVTASKKADVGGFVGSITGSGSNQIDGAVFTRVINVSGSADANVGGIVGLQSGSAGIKLTNCRFTTGFEVKNSNGLVVHKEDSEETAINVKCTGNVYTGGIYGTGENISVILPEGEDKDGNPVSIVGDRTGGKEACISSTGSVGGIGGNGAPNVNVSTSESSPAFISDLKITVNSDKGKGSKAGGVFGEAENHPDLYVNLYGIEITTDNTGSNANSALGGVFGTVDGLAKLSLTVDEESSVSLSGGSKADGACIGSIAGICSGKTESVNYSGNFDLKNEGSGGMAGGFAGMSGGNMETVLYSGEFNVENSGTGGMAGGFAGQNTGVPKNINCSGEVSIVNKGNNGMVGGFMGKNAAGASVDGNGYTIICSGRLDVSNSGNYFLQGHNAK